MFINTLPTRKSLIVSATLLSVILHGGLIWALSQFDVSISPSYFSSQNSLILQLVTISNSNQSAPKNIIVTSTPALTPSKNQQIKESLTTENQKFVAAAVKKPELVDAKKSVNNSLAEPHSKQLQKPNPKQIKIPSETTEAKQKSVSKQKSLLVENESRVLQAEQASSSVADEVALSELPSKNTTMPFKKSTQSKPRPQSGRYQLGRYPLNSHVNPAPKYPMLARKKGWQGEVVLGVYLAADGSIERITFVKSTDYTVLNNAAYNTVKNHWRFDDLLDQSDAADAYVEVPILFTLN